MRCAVAAISRARVQANSSGDLEASTCHKHPDDLVDGYAFEQRETSGCHVNSALRIVKRIGLIGSAFRNSLVNCDASLPCAS